MQKVEKARQVADVAEGIPVGLAVLGKPVYYCELADLMKHNWPDRWDRHLSERYDWFHEGLG